MEEILNRIKALLRRRCEMESFRLSRTSFCDFHQSEVTKSTLMSFIRPLRENKQLRWTNVLFFTVGI